jgi:hypothetical protein
MRSPWRPPGRLAVASVKPPAPKPLRTVTRPPCVHLGEHIGFQECQGCRGTVKLKVFACSHPSHGKTTLRHCQVCPDYIGKPDGIPASNDATESKLDT